MSQRRSSAIPWGRPVHDCDSLVAARAEPGAIGAHELFGRCSSCCEGAGDPGEWSAGAQFLFAKEVSVCSASQRGADLLGQDGLSIPTSPQSRSRDDARGRTMRNG